MNPQYPSNVSGRARLRSIHSLKPRKAEQPKRVPLGKILIDMGAVDPGNLLKATAMRAREDVRLGDILLAHGWVSEDNLMAALARQWDSSVLDIDANPSDPRLIDAMGAETCLRNGVIPWRRIGETVVIATSRPGDFATFRDQLPAIFHPCRMVIAPEVAIHRAILSRRQTAMIRHAEHLAPAQESCRTSNPAVTSNVALMVIFVLALSLMAMPNLTITLVTGWAIFSLVAFMVLKTVCCIAGLGVQLDRNRRRNTPPPHVFKLPTISILVPLLREPDIAAVLVDRLGKLNYPRELLDILLVVESDDTITRDALDQAVLPRWMRVITVPDGPIRTKPRAMNFAMNFCRGSIIGVYDAEDRPDPEQLHIVAREFAQSAPNVACLQGMLDFYNPRTNWIARCFTIEYATWFRLYLPGLARLGFVVPLGGTTLFFRRTILEEIGAWDAHNVTEDADLGVRLARRGYRTKLIDTATHEEANCRPMPWIKQRSRWLKGYAMTWAVHMRNPAALWRDLGPKRFFGVQVIFLCALSQYLLMPVLWSFWGLLFGLPHPVASVVPQGWMPVLIGVMVVSELTNILCAAIAVRGGTHRHLIPWTATMMAYYPMAAIAGWRAIFEAVTKPFHWEKTAHGIYEQDADPSPPADTALAPVALTAYRDP